MMLRSHSVWVVPVAATLLGFGPGAGRATAQSINNFPFTATFDSITTLERTSVPNVFRSTDIARSTDAPFGLNRFENMNFSEVNFNTGVVRFGPDPTAFGLQGPISTATFFGNGSDRLFATFSGSASLFTNKSSGTINIFGGEGRFSGATGTLFGGCHIQFGLVIYRSGYIEGLLPGVTASSRTRNYCRYAGRSRCGGNQFPAAPTQR